MFNFFRNNALVLFLLLFSTVNFHATAGEKPFVRYTLSMPAPHTHYFEVEMAVHNISKPFIDVVMPVWAPGSYLVREFSRNVENFRVIAANKTLSCKKINKSTWRIQSNQARLLRIRYRVYANELTVRTSFLDSSHGYVNGSSVFMYIVGHLRMTHYLQVILPGKWNKISTGLESVSGRPYAYLASDYDILVDCPLEMGTHRVLSFSVNGIEHEVAIYGYGNFEEQQLLNDMKKIVETTAEIVGEIPYQRYVFIFHVLPGLWGGLEHLNSTTVQVGSWSFKGIERYSAVLGLIAHEYFHLWNVKRIRPETLGPFDYSRENYTTLLWVVEGITSYYEYWILQKSGLISQGYYFDILQSKINALQNNPGRKYHSLEQASFDAWIKFYRKDENFANSSISYYRKGSIAGLLLDLHIITITNGKKNLDDVMRFLWNTYYIEKNRGFSPEEFQKACEMICNRGLDDFFAANIKGTRELSYNQYFMPVGLQLKRIEESALFLGITPVEKNGQWIVKYIVKDSPAYKGGLNVNDEIIAIDNLRVNSTNFDSLLARKKLGEISIFLISRAGVIKKLEIVFNQNRHYYHLEKISSNPYRRYLQDKWLKRD